jgi:hypothetical protein
MLFEVASRRRQEKRIDERIERITKNVFLGVFRRELPDKLMDEASLLILEANFIRKGFIVNYTISDGMYKTPDGRDMPFIMLRAVTEFILRNISSDNCPVMIGVGLPNPIEPNLIKVVDITSLKVLRDSGLEEVVDLKEEIPNMRKEMEDTQSIMSFVVDSISCNRTKRSRFLQTMLWQKKRKIQKYYRAYSRQTACA